MLKVLRRIGLFRGIDPVSYTHLAGQRGEARSATLPLPDVILEQVRAGEALGPVMSQYTGIDQIGRKEGAIGVFTGGRLTRSSVYHQAVVLALSPFHNAIYR